MKRVLADSDDVWVQSSRSTGLWLTSRGWPSVEQTAADWLGAGGSDVTMTSRLSPSSWSIQNAFMRRSCDVARLALKSRPIVSYKTDILKSFSSSFGVITNVGTKTVVSFYTVHN